MSIVIACPYGANILREEYQERLSVGDNSQQLKYLK